MITQTCSPSSAASSQRPIPLQGRRDLAPQRMEFQGAAWWVLKDPVGMVYHRIRAEQYQTLCLLDGQRSLKQIRDRLAAEFPTVPLSLADVQFMITDLHGKGLVSSNRPGQAALLMDRQHANWWRKIPQTFGNLLSLRLPGWDPDALLRRMHPFLSWIYHPATGVLSALLVLSAWGLLVVQFHEFRSRLPAFQQFFGWPNLIWLWLTLGATKILHEFGHGLTCKHYGRECHEMGVMLLVLSPCLYCDVTDSWMLRNKWQRIWIATAGMVIEVVLSAVAIFLWWFTRPGLLNHLCLNVFFITTVTTVIFNANPLLRYDGYYILSDWLGIPNLRAKADQMLRDTFARWCLGIVRPADPLMPVRGRGWFVAFAIAAGVYRWFVLCAILLFLYVVLKPYGLQSLGIALAVFSLAAIVRSLLVSVWRIIAAPRSAPMSLTRTFLTVGTIAALGVGALLIPLPLHIEAPFLIEPRDVTHVFTTMPGQLTSFLVRPGDRVEQGQILATLSDGEKEDHRRKLAVERSVELTEISALHALERVSEHALARKKLESIENQLRDYDEQLAELTIKAPVSGRVVAAPRVPAPVRRTPRRLSEWSGDLSHPQNLGCLLPNRTHLLSIAPDGKMQAMLYLDQAHREDLEVGQQIEIKFDHLPDRTYTVRVADIARQQSDVAPTPLSNKLGGGLPSVTDAEGHERLTSVAYQARVVLDEETHLVKPGMRGNARFLVERRPAAIWIWRSLRRTLHFRL